ncbi:hypothetical protein QVD17_37253 [Tagetes erecta]|uniref:Uncharacterized protein n=1 Tax=Tagetes erecta TaxID=13708 RepID=A0AAD8JW58_TARER|nr:hypothetical protein QVD17_37253 [Tagetes erecta]
MAGVDYKEWGVDFEEWERMETGAVLPPHLYADDYFQEDEDKRDEEVIVTMETPAIDEFCGSIEFKNLLTEVFDEKCKKGRNIMNRVQVSIEALAMTGTDHVEWGMDRILKNGSVWTWHHLRLTYMSNNLKVMKGAIL